MKLGLGMRMPLNKLNGSWVNRFEELYFKSYRPTNQLHKLTSKV